MNILGTGLSGLVGSRVVELLSDVFSFQNLSLETGVDITDPAVVETHVKSSGASWVFHFAARTDVEGAEAEAGNRTGSYWKTNVDATASFVDACKKYKKKLLYISTDYVFDGTKERYDERDIPRPLCWYGVTKYEGEKLVASLGSAGLIVRIANPYCEKPQFKPDFVHKIAALLKDCKTIYSPTDQVFVPTFIDDVAITIGNLVQASASGIYHVVGSTAISPYDASRMIAEAVCADPALVRPVTFQEYFRGRARRPRLAHLDNAKAASHGVRLSTFAAGLAIIRNHL